MIAQNTEDIKASSDPAVISHFALRSCREQNRLVGAAADTKHKGIQVTEGQGRKGMLSWK